MQLPGELIDVLSYLGMTWPEADEELLKERGDHWMAFGEAGDGQRTLANDAVAAMLATNQSRGLDRFSDTWDRVGGDWGHLNGSTVTAEAVAVAYYACAALVLAMKLAVIVQLVALAVVIAAAVAASFFTLGASLAAAAAFARTIFTIIQRIVRLTIAAIDRYGPILAELVGGLLQIGTLVLDQRPIHGSDDGRDGAETEQEKAERERERAERREELAADPDHGGQANDKTRREADVALGLEDSGALTPPVERGPRGADFRDGDGQLWDVKGYQSRPGQRGNYDPTVVQAAIEGKINSGQNVILDLSGLNDADRVNLIQMVQNSPSWAGRVVVY